MLQRLAAAEPLLVEYRKHRGVALAQAGERIALEIICHHWLLELYLHQKLGFAWDEVHEEADRLEHVISENFEERIAQALGDPSHDPTEIPSRRATCRCRLRKVSRCSRCGRALRCRRWPTRPSTRT